MMQNTTNGWKVRGKVGINGEVKFQKCIVHMDPKAKPGHRIPDINWKLTELFTRGEQKTEMFRLVQGDVAIEVLGKYNPLYAGRPKRLAMALLNALSGYVPVRSSFFLAQSGLGYRVPALIGVRAERLRISAAGLALLDYWAEAFPRFKLFLLAYDNKKARQEIMADCFDLAMGYTPASFKAIEERNKLLQIKWEAREYRRMKKEEERKAQEERNRMLQTDRLLQAQTLAQLQSLQAAQQAISQPPWYSSSSSSTSASGGLLGGSVVKGIL